MAVFASGFTDPTPSNRPNLSFRQELTSTGALKDEWSFIRDDALRSNIAATLQDVEFDIYLVNRYNVFWTPLAMKLKHAIVQAASVAEAALDYMLRMVEDDPRVKKAFGSRWTLRDFANVPMPGVDLPEGVRVVSGTQEQIPNVLDRNTKMQLLIRAARAVEIVDDDLAEELDNLRDLRNRIHIKTLTDPEYAAYTPKMANDALDTLGRLRDVALRWTVQQRAADLRAPAMFDTLASSVRSATTPGTDDVNFSLSLDDLVHHATLGAGLVVGVEGSVVSVRFFGDGSVRRLMPEFAPMHKTGVFAPDDDISL
jgi:hypothetical protein